MKRNAPRVAAVMHILACLTAAERAGAQAAHLEPSDVAAIREARHLATSLGPTVWHTWSGADRAPLVYRAGGREFFLEWPGGAPPGAERTDGVAGGQSAWVRPIASTDAVQATMDYEGVYTVVISAPAPGDDASLWALKAAHEFFHVFQGPQRAIDPFVGAFKNFNDLTFPFEYQRPAVRAALRLEGEILFRAATAADSADIGLTTLPRLAKQVRVVDSAIFSSPEHLAYKDWTEWSEGVARYTERRLADLARDARYAPVAEFRRHFPSADYAKTWRASYANALNPIRFVGEGFSTRTVFYYTGMAKAYALDRLNPSWKDRFRTTSLDGLLTAVP